VLVEKRNQGDESREGRRYGFLYLDKEDM